MAISSDSYGTVEEVEALTRHLLDGHGGYSLSTVPRLADVEQYIDRLSALLNTALAARGFSIPVTNATAKLSLDDWVVTKTAAYAELSQRGAGFSDGENTRPNTLKNLHREAAEFVNMNALGWQRLGAGMDAATSTGFVFTGMDKQSERADQDNSSREQPLFTRHQFEA